MHIAKAKLTFSSLLSLFTIRFPFTVIHGHQSLMANGKRMENGQWKMVNASEGGT